MVFNTKPTTFRKRYVMNITQKTNSNQINCPYKKQINNSHQYHVEHQTNALFLSQKLRLLANNKRKRQEKLLQFL